MNSALLVGINSYKSSEVGDLDGCENDVSLLSQYLQEEFEGKDSFRIQTLLNKSATRGELIRQFRKHLGKAKEGDIALFFFSGHGSKEEASSKIQKWMGGNLFNETLVCYDSRIEDYDLADKELAVLIHEVAQNGAEVILILDCCHSGSVSRSTHKIRSAPPFSREKRDPNTYLEGEFTRKPAHLPSSKHLVLAACGKDELASEYEFGGKSYGAFTYRLISNARSHGGPIAYKDLFFQTREDLKRLQVHQTPQLVTGKGFRAQKYFLRPSYMDALSKSRYPCYWEEGAWWVNQGIVHGLGLRQTLPTEPTFNAYNDLTDSKKIGSLIISKAALERSQVKWLNPEVHTPDPQRTYWAEQNAAVSESLSLYLENAQGETRGLFPGTAPLGLQAKYVLSIHEKEWTLRFLETQEEIFQVSQKEWALDMIQMLIRWEYTFQLRNYASNQVMIDSGVDSYNPPCVLDFQVESSNGESNSYINQPFITLDLREEDPAIAYQIQLANHSFDNFYCTLVYLSSDFGMETRYHDTVMFTQQPYIITTDHEIYVHPTGIPQSTDRFLCILSETAVEEYVFNQDSITTYLRNQGIKYESFERFPLHDPNRYHRWVVHPLTIRSLKELGQISASPLELPQYCLRIESHTSFKAGVSLIFTTQNMECMDWEIQAMRRDWEVQGFQLWDFDGEGRGATILDIHDIQGENSLQDEPLSLKIDLGSSEEGYLLPFSFDGSTYISFPISLHNEKVLIQISQVPPNPPDGRLEGIRSLKLGFLKLNQKQFQTTQTWNTWKLSIDRIEFLKNQL